MTIRSAVRFVPPAAAMALLATPVAGQGASCADALAAGEVAARDTAELIEADLTLDGAVDAAYWWADSAGVVVLIGRCDRGEVRERWRFVVADCPPTVARVEPATLLLDDALLERACAGERSASECAHLRRENARRQALMDAGGRALRIGGPSCTAETLRWSPGQGGFLRIPR